MDLDINLLVKKNNYYRIERIFQQGRRLTVVLGFFAVLLLTLILFLQQGVKRNIDTFASERTNLQKEINSKQEAESKIRLLNSKLLAMDGVMSTAPDYGTYYDRLVRFLPSKPEDGTLTKMNFSSPNLVVVELEFPDILALTKFLGTIESKDFLSQFDSIRLSNIVFATSPEVLTLKVHLAFHNESQD